MVSFRGQIKVKKYSFHQASLYLSYVSRTPLPTPNHRKHVRSKKIVNRGFCVCYEESFILKFHLLLILFFFLTLKAYIQYMKFARRAEGIKESRAVFKRAREDSRTNFHVSVKMTSRCRFHFLSKFADVYLKKI